MLGNVSFVDKVSNGVSLAIGVYSDGSLSCTANSLSDSLKNFIIHSANKLNFKGKLFDTASFVSSDENFNHIVLVGLGTKDKKFQQAEVERIGASIYLTAKKLDENLLILLESSDLHVPCPCAPAFLAFGALLKSWKFEKYRTKHQCPTKLKNVSVLVKDIASAQQQFDELQKVSDGIFLTREVNSEPANVIYPESLADIAKKELEPLGVSVEILDVNEMQKLGMNAILAVGQGSQRPPRLVVLSWNHGKPEDAPVAFVGKGITFDSGGISIKPDDGMDDMKYDMSGAGTVLGLFKAIAKNKLPVNAVGAIALAENMPSGSAQRPGDIIKTMSGQTVEVLSTDAEGRLVLCDALWYMQNRFKPRAMVDLATLTGAIVVALGHEFAGLFSNCDDLAAKITASANDTGEKVWRMPLSEHFDRCIDSTIADIRNLGKPGTRAGGTTAAQFLQRFVNGVAWAHIDIAGVEFSKSDELFLCNGVTGFGVHLLYDFLKKNYAN